MPPKPRDTKLTRELAVAKLPSGPPGDEILPAGSRLLAEGFS